MIFTALLFTLPLLILLKGLRHWLYGAHILLLCAVSWWKFPSLEYQLLHPYYVYFLGGWHLGFITLVTFAAYGWDKRQAKWGGWRVPERTLHALAFIGGSLGAWLGSKIFRHKTIKGSFKQMFIGVVILQAILIGGTIWVLNF
jgi:uncharacterized membrane protein YsdA (DUF1294 family)